MAELVDARLLRGIYAGHALAVDEGLVEDPIELSHVDHLTAQAYELGAEVVRQAERMTGAQQEITGQVAALTVVARRNSRYQAAVDEVAEALRRLWEVIDDGWSP